MISSVVSIRRLKPLLGKGYQTNSLPIGLNRISWKRLFPQPLTGSANPKPYRLG